MTWLVSTHYSLFSEKASDRKYRGNSPGINTSQLGWMCLLKWSQKAPERKITFVGTWKHSWILILGTVGDTNRHYSGCLEGELESSSPGDLVSSCSLHRHIAPSLNMVYTCTQMQVKIFFKKIKCGEGIKKYITMSASGHTQVSTPAHTHTTHTRCKQVWVLHLWSSIDILTYPEARLYLEPQ